jgi:hypothetical protein
MHRKLFLEVCRARIQCSSHALLQTEFGQNGFVLDTTLSAREHEIVNCQRVFREAILENSVNT